MAHDNRALRRVAAGIYEYGVGGQWQPFYDADAKQWRGRRIPRAVLGCIVNLGDDWLVTDACGNEIGRARTLAGAKAYAAAGITEAVRRNAAIAGLRGRNA